MQAHESERTSREPGKPLAVDEVRRAAPGARTLRVPRSGVGLQLGCPACSPHSGPGPGWESPETSPIGGRTIGLAEPDNGQDRAKPANEWSDVYDLLEQVRLRPGMWVYQGSVQELSAMLFGYSLALQVHDASESFDSHPSWPADGDGLRLLSRLTQAVRLIRGSCSSVQGFASGFLLTPPHDGAVASGSELAPPLPPPSGPRRLNGR